ncbi:MAG: DUF4388 domain-containing protein [Trueperaceae bacterium]|nr:DUF4388 domain-containing protein [Trueperaceae bacterium]
MNALEGRLADGVLSNLVQYLSLNQASGCLNVAAPTVGSGEVYLVRGRVQHAVVGSLVGRPALAHLIAWKQGRFSFRVGVVPPTFSIDLPTDQLLLHASYEIDVERRRPGSNGVHAMPSPTLLVEPAVVPGLVWAAVATAGPIGEIFVDEAFDSLGHNPRLMPEGELGQLVQAIAGHFKSTVDQQDFLARAEAVLAHNGYGRVEE